MTQKKQFGTPIQFNTDKPLSLEDLGFDPSDWQVSQEVIDEAQKISDQNAVNCANCKLLVR